MYNESNDVIITFSSKTLWSIILRETNLFQFSLSLTLTFIVCIVNYQCKSHGYDLQNTNDRISPFCDFPCMNKI